jgi:protein-tyrosine-phosphatase
MTTRVLFLCPHAAGKSLLAATYFRAAAARAGLDVAIAVAGPEPDDVNMAPVEAELESQGFRIGWQPKLVADIDVEAADIVVSIGCDHASIPGTPDITEWDVPTLSDDFAGSVRAIHTRAEALAAGLAHPRPPAVSGTPPDRVPDHGESPEEEV